MEAPEPDNGVDPTYEFAMPQFVDLNDDTDDPNADQWFDEQSSSMIDESFGMQEIEDEPAEDADVPTASPSPTPSAAEQPSDEADAPQAMELCVEDVSLPEVPVETAAPAPKPVRKAKRSRPTKGKSRLLAPTASSKRRTAKKGTSSTTRRPLTARTGRSRVRKSTAQPKTARGPRSAASRTKPAASAAAKRPQTARTGRRVLKPKVPRTATSTARRTARPKSRATSSTATSRAKSRPKPAAKKAEATSKWAHRLRSASKNKAHRPSRMVERLASTHTASSRARVEKRKEERSHKKRKSDTLNTKLTVAKSPIFRTKSRRKQKTVLTTEQRILQQIEQSKQNAEKRRKLNARKVARVLESVGRVLPTRSTAALTEPQEFRSFTAERATRRRAISQTPKPKKKSESRRSRSSARRPQTQPMSSRAKKPRKLTRPVPFKFSTDERVNRVPRTPSKSPERRIRHITRSSAKPSTFVPQTTTPRSPSLSTKKRERPSRVKSTAEREEEEMKNMPQFKARPLNPEVMQSTGDLGVPRIPKSKPTHFKEFHLSTEERGALAKPVDVVDKDEEELKKQFKATPFNPAKFSKQPQVKIQHKPLTVPRSPNLSKPSKKRKSTDMSDDTPIFKARPMPVSSPFKVQYKKQHIESAPFNLATEQRGALHEQEMQRQLEQQAEEEYQQRHFKARPILEVDPSASVAPVQPKKLTVPQPFQLKSVELSERARQEIASRIQQEMQEDLAKTEFHARPLPLDSAFVLKKSDRPLTEVEPFPLYSNMRAEQREDFDRAMAQKAQENSQRQAALKKEQEAREAAELRDLRKRLVHKPLPVPNAVPFMPMKSNKELTEPISPNFLTEKRAAMHSGDQDVHMEVEMEV